MMKVLASVLLLVTFAVGEIRKPYEGHKIVEVKAESRHQLKAIRHLQHDNDIDFWTEPRALNIPINIRIPPKKYEDVTSFLKQQNIHFKVIRENVQEGVDKEMARLAERFQNPAEYAFNIDDFNTYDDTMQFVEGLKSQCASGVTCRTYSVGNSIEGRELKVFHMSTGAGKKAFWMDSAIHAREWLSPATVLKILNRLVTEYSSNADAKRLVDTYDFYFLPNMNPDGYIYSWTSERFWRKNRVDNGNGCFGTDLNRNYDVQWMHDGTSSDPCSDTYGGASAASEPETKAVQTEIRRLGSSLRALITVHTAALMWIHPYGHTDDVTGTCAIAPDHDQMSQVARAAADAAEASGGLYWQSGNSCQVIYAATGATDDYAYTKAGVKYAFTPELRGPGFDPPNTEIEPSFNENWAALLAVEQTITSIEGAP